MPPVFPSTLKDEDRLAYLAMHFRGTRNEAERRAIARDYAETVHRLIARGNWEESPAPDEQLPYAWMPREFFEFWSGR
jgi:hypothetical protein